MSSRWLGPVTRVYAIARNTFMEAARNRAFLGLGIAAIALVVSSMVVSGLAISDQWERVLIDFGLFVISLLEVIIAIVLGVILIFKEIERKTFYLVLPKPVRRTEVLLGKFVGLLAVLGLALLFMSVAWVFALTARKVGLRPDMVKALLLVWMEAALVTAIATFFSSFATPIMSGVFTIGAFIVGGNIDVLRDLLTLKKGVLVTNAFARALAEVTVYIFPDLTAFRVGKELIIGIPITWSYVGATALYCAGYCLLFCALGALVFSRRDFV